MLIRRTALLTLLIAITACSRAAGSESADATRHAVSTLVPPAGITAQEILDRTLEVIDNAASFEVRSNTVLQRSDSRTENELNVLQADEAATYRYSRNGEQVTEVIRIDGTSYNRSYYTGQTGGLWEHRPISPGANPPRTPVYQLHELENPRVVGTEEVDGALAYVLEGTTPIPQSYGGIGIQAKFQPGTYRLIVDMETMAPVSLTSTGVSWIEIDGVSNPDNAADRTVSVEFSSVNMPVSVSAPGEDMLVHPDTATPTPDPRFPATPTPPSH